MVFSSFNRKKNRQYIDQHIHTATRVTVIMNKKKPRKDGAPPSPESSFARRISNSSDVTRDTERPQWLILQRSASFSGSSIGDPDCGLDELYPIHEQGQIKEDCTTIPPATKFQRSSSRFRFFANSFRKGST